MNSLFCLKDPLVNYTSSKENKPCEELDCVADNKCTCSQCLCCSVCSALCECPAATHDPNKKIAEILDLGDWAYR